MLKGPPAKRLGFVRIGRELRTTVPLIADFLAANITNPPRFPARTSILEQDVIARATLLLQELLRGGRVLVDARGHFRVEPAPSPPPKEKGPQPDGQRAEENPTPVLNGVEP
jgi:hypothetical protein